MSRQAGIVADYFGFMEEVGQRLRGARTDPPAGPRGALLDAHPGLHELFETLVSASPTARAVKDRKTEEWNPLSQRILLPDERPVAASALETDFALVPMYAQSFVEWAHEAAHILVLEPWFAGHRRILSEEDFVTWYLAGEAFAFWYADIVVTRAIRRTVPEADLVFTRSSVSNTGFHPEQAFERLGLTGDDAILPVYVAAFLGEAPELRMSGDPFCAAYGQRLHDFYRDSRVMLKSLHALLEEFGIFGDFQRRFCRAGDLPSILPPEAGAAASNLQDYVVALGQRFLPGIAGTAQPQLRRVTARRHIQMRAYYGWLLRWALDNGWVAAEGGFASRTVSARVSHYLDALEAALAGLALGGTPEEALGAVAEADLLYEIEVRAPLSEATAHVSYRYWIFPYLEKAGGIIGYWDARTGYSPDEAEAALRHVFERCRWEPELVEILADFLAHKREGRDREARAAFNAFLRHPVALPEWAILLGGIDPGRSQFREPLFEYH